MTGSEEKQRLGRRRGTILRDRPTGMTGPANTGIYALVEAWNDFRGGGIADV